MIPILPEILCLSFIETANFPNFKRVERKIMRNILLVCALIVLLPILAAAQGNTFNFQGRLNDGTNPANGAYDLQFKLFDAITGGTQIGSTISRPNTALINGVFSVNLDFGATAFNNPNSIFIEIAVRPNASPNAFTILGPRQQLTVVPFSVRANNATNADTSTTANNALSLGNVPASSYARLDVINNGDLRLTGGLYLDGDIRQASNSSGAVKAMARIRVTRSGFPNFPSAAATVVTCVSAVVPPGTPNCGITFGSTIGEDNVLISFGFSVSNRFVSLTGFNDTVSILGFPNGSTVNVDDTTTNGGSSEFFIYVF